MAILIVFSSLLTIKKPFKNHLIFEFLNLYFSFLAKSTKRRGWVLLLLRQDNRGNSSSRSGFRYYCGEGRRLAKQASKQAH
jgi:hypothetical protein